MAEFNLIDEPWIPCIDLHGNGVENGIRDTLLKAHELREVCDDSPLVTVAIHRLLLAIVYRALSGPTGFDAWKGVYAKGCFEPGAVQSYLDKWKPRFDLFDRDVPFYQMAGLETRNPVSVNRLAAECASGNNATLFDHCSDELKTEWIPAQVARQLVACQSFALALGVSAKARIGGRDEDRPRFTDAIATRGMNVWLQGNSLVETLAVNLVPVCDKSLPPWELNDQQQYRDRQDGKKRKTVSSFGIVDRLTWQSRLIRFTLDGDTVSQMHFTQGRSADKGIGDPMKVYRTDKEEGISAVPLGRDKAAWRDSYSLLMIPAAGSNERRPECFNLVARASALRLVDPARSFSVQVVGLASAPSKASKLLLWRHERLPIPASLLGDANIIGRLGLLIQSADHAAIQLNHRTQRIAKLYLSPTSETPNGRQPDRDEVTRVAESLDPRPAYWARLERYFYTLLENLPGDWDRKRGDWKPDNVQTATREWREHVKREAKRSLEENIRSLGTTGRAIQAVARVQTNFTDDDLKPRPQAAAKARKKGGGKK